MVSVDEAFWLSLSATRFPVFMTWKRAHDRTRTDDLFLTKEVLYRLSYVGVRHHTIRKRETGLEPATLSLEG